MSSYARASRSEIILFMMALTVCPAWLLFRVQTATSWRVQVLMLKLPDRLAHAVRIVQVRAVNVP